MSPPNIASFILVYFYVLLCTFYTRTLRKEEVQRLKAFEMHCYRRLLGVSWQEKIRNRDSSKNSSQMLIDTDAYAEWITGASL